MQKITPVHIILWVGVIVSLFAPSVHANIDIGNLAERSSVQLTIYNTADLTLVREQRMLNLAKGLNELRFSWADTRIDPTSLSIGFGDNACKIKPIRVSYPPGTNQVATWQINSAKTCTVTATITYFTSGISWEAHYRALLSKDGRQCDFDGFIRVTNASGEDYTNAQIRLIIGKIDTIDNINELAGRPHPFGSPHKSYARQEIKKMMLSRDMRFTASEAAGVPAPARIGSGQSASELFLYTIDGEVSIRNGWSKSMQSIKARKVPVKETYRYGEAGFDPIKLNTAATRFLILKNNMADGLGTAPISSGELKVFRCGKQKGSLDFIGKDSIGYIPVNKTAVVNLGSSSRVSIIPRIISYKKEGIRFDKAGNISGFDEVLEMEIKLSNQTDDAAVLEFTKNLSSNRFKVSRISHPETFTRVDLNTIRFSSDLPPQSTQVITYILSISRGEQK